MQTPRFQFIAPRFVVLALAHLFIGLGLLAQAYAAPSSAPHVILVVGDSLSAGNGIGIDAAWPTLLDKRLRANAYEYVVTNASVSGETSTGANARLGRLLAQHQPRITIIEIGANDGLRGLPLVKIRQNLQAMIESASQHQSRVLLVGMRIPPNYGDRYTEGFYSMYTGLAKQNQLAHVPFLLDNVALDPSLMQSDGLHPTAAAQPRLLDNVWKALEPMLRAESKKNAKQ